MLSETFVFLHVLLLIGCDRLVQQINIKKKFVIKKKRMKRNAFLFAFLSALHVFLLSNI